MDKHRTVAIAFTFTAKVPERLVITLLLIEVLLAVIYLTAEQLPISTVARLFDLDQEATIPAWFSSMQLLLIGILFFSSGPWPRGQLAPSPHFLRFVGIAFIFLSLDEAAAFHEKIHAALRGFAWMPSFRGGHGTWILVYLPIALVLLGIASRSIVLFSKSYRTQSHIILLGALIFLTGAVGVEIIGYQYLRVPTHAHLYKYGVLLEETLEMAGASLVLYGTMLCANPAH